MKGDDRPFDHQLLMYPCTNYVSKGHCSRGESCLFSLKLLPKEDVAETSNISTPEVKSYSLSGISTSEKPEKTVAKRENQKDQSASSYVQKLNDIPKGITRAPPPKGINFLSFGKAPLASLTISSTQSSLTQILQKNGIPKSFSSLDGLTNGFRSVSVKKVSSLRSGAASIQVNTTPSDKQQNFQIIPKGLTTNPFGSGQSSDFPSHAFIKNTPVSSQKALMSTCFCHED